MVSVGNLTVGGTGKTPLIGHFLQWASEQNLKVGVVSRGYGARFEGCQVVRAGEPPVFGDEPQMLANQFPGVPIYVDPDRVRAASRLVEDHSVDLLLADDGFQHLRLKRDLDLVVMDALEPADHYKVLPWGRARENLTALARASHIVVTKVNLVTEEVRQGLKLVLHRQAPGVPVVEAHLVFSGLFPMLGAPSARAVALPLAGQKVLAVSGIGRPQSFAKLLEEQNVNLVEQIIFADHHNYSLKDVKRIGAEAQRLGCEAVVVTAKDAVKLQNFSPEDLGFTYLVTQVKVELLKGAQRIYEDLHRLAGPRP